MESARYLGRIESIAYSDKKTAHIHLDLAELPASVSLPKFRLSADSKLRQVYATVERRWLSKVLPKNVNRETSWIEVEFNENGEQTGLIQDGVGLSSLISEPRQEKFNLKAIESQTSRYLNQNTKTPIPVSNFGEILIETNKAFRPVHDAIALNVGQGNATAVVDQNYRAIFYHDTGGSSITGWYYLRPPLPANFPNLHRMGIPDRPVFSTEESTFVILSHWDVDHWLHAADPKNSALMNCVWIAPELTGARPIHVAMIEELRRRNKILIWPNGLQRIDTAFGFIAKADGPFNNRNNSGLYIELDSEERKILLTGDASYKHMPHARSSYDSLIVPHHGGAALGNSLLPNAVPNPRLVYSCGMHNRHRHPLAPTLTSHNNAGWPLNGIQTMLINKNVSLIQKAPRHGPGLVCPAAPDHSMTCACDATTI